MKMEGSKKDLFLLKIVLEILCAAIHEYVSFPAFHSTDLMY